MPEKSDERFLIVRLGSLGDLVHTLPAIASLRDSFPGARIDWLIERKWAALLDGNPDLNETVRFDRGSWGMLRDCVRRLRAMRYTCAIDFQGLYKSAILTALSGAPRRVGFNRHAAREGIAAVLYTPRAACPAGDGVPQNPGLGGAAGARQKACRFSGQGPPAAEAGGSRRLA